MSDMSVLTCTSCYRSIARTCFPNSVCIVDHFHLSQELGRRIDSVRIRTMKKYSETGKSDEYYLLKKFNWMIFKSDINSEPVMDPNAERKWNGHFRKYMNLYEIKDLLFSIDPQLQEAWNMKDSIVDFYSTATIENAREKLNRIIEDFDDSSVTEMNAFAKTLKKMEKKSSIPFTSQDIDIRLIRAQAMWQLQGKENEQCDH